MLATSRTKRRAVVLAAAVAGAGLAAGASTLSPAAASAPQHRVIASIHTSLGRVVSTPSGRVMYLFEADDHGRSTCHSKCQAVWPRVTSMAAAWAGAHISATHLSRTATGQVRYFGHPLYFYTGDNGSREHHGEGLRQFGAEWYVVSPHGKKVEDEGDDHGDDGAHHDVGDDHGNDG